MLLLPTATIAATASGSSKIIIAVGIAILVVVIVIISSFTSNGSSGLRCYGIRRSAPTTLGSVGRGGGSRKGALPHSCEGPTRKRHRARLVFARGTGSVDGCSQWCCRQSHPKSRSAGRAVRVGSSLLRTAPLNLRSILGEPPKMLATLEVRRCSTDAAWGVAAMESGGGKWRVEAEVGGEECFEV